MIYFEFCVFFFVNSFCRNHVNIERQHPNLPGQRIDQLHSHPDGVVDDVDGRIYVSDSDESSSDNDSDSVSSSDGSMNSDYEYDGDEAPSIEPFDYQGLLEEHRQHQQREQELQKEEKVQRLLREHREKKRQRKQRREERKYEKIQRKTVREQVLNRILQESVQRYQEQPNHSNRLELEHNLQIHRNRKQEDQRQQQEQQIEKRLENLHEKQRLEEQRMRHHLHCSNDPNCRECYLASQLNTFHPTDEQIEQIIENAKSRHEFVHHIENQSPRDIFTGPPTPPPNAFGKQPLGNILTLNEENDNDLFRYEHRHSIPTKRESRIASKKEFNDMLCNGKDVFRESDFESSDDEDDIDYYDNDDDDERSGKRKRSDDDEEEDIYDLFVNAQIERCKLRRLQ